MPTTERDEQIKADLWFPRLAVLLDKHVLPCQDGTTRKASVDEFMFMGLNAGGADFKHRDTRRYVHVTPKSDRFELTIQSGGFYDWFEIEGL